MGEKMKEGTNLLPFFIFLNNLRKRSPTALIIWKLLFASSKYFFLMDSIEKNASLSKGTPFIFVVAIIPLLKYQVGSILSILLFHLFLLACPQLFYGFSSTRVHLFFMLFHITHLF